MDSVSTLSLLFFLWSMIALSLSIYSIESIYNDGKQFVFVILPLCGFVSFVICLAISFFVGCEIKSRVRLFKTVGSLFVYFFTQYFLLSAIPMFRYLLLTEDVWVESVFIMLCVMSTLIIHIVVAVLSERLLVDKFCNVWGVLKKKSHC